MNPQTHCSTLLSPLPFKPSLSLSSSHRRRRLRISSAAQPPPSGAASFVEKRELTGIQPFVDKLSPPVRLAASLIAVAGAAAAGYGLGLRFSADKTTAIGGAAVAGVAGCGVAYAINAAVPDVAAASVRNYVVACDDPKDVRKEEIESIARRYGVNKQDAAFNAELCDIYCRFVSSVLPPGSEDLKGDEVETIVKFKSALGIEDPDAAAMHMEIGRRFFRQRLEAGDPEGLMEERRAFQKLIYVSTLVFGEASTFLLPWRRLFKVTESQVEVAIRDNAQRLYNSKLRSVGRDIDAGQLISLREAQLLYRLADDLAEDLFREHTRKILEENMSSAINILRSRTRAGPGAKKAIDELNKMLAFNHLLISLKNHPDADRFVPGVGPVSLVGGDYDSDRNINDLKLLYQAYVTDSLSSGRMEEKIDALSQLRNIFGLGIREADAITVDVTSKVYRKRLSQAVSSGDLEAADSKAVFLQNLCDELHFNPQKASGIHEEIYRRKLQQCVANGELSGEDAKVLLRLRVLLCIPQQTVEAAHADICGSLFNKVLKEAISSGVDGYDGDIRKSVRKAAHSLRLTKDTAMSIASKAVRRIFMDFIERAQATGKRTESTEELKKMIAYNTLVVTELVADIKGESPDAPSEEPIIEVEQPKEKEDEWKSIQTFGKIKPNNVLEGKLRKPGQKEINLKEDLPERDRIDLYKTYLLFSLTGNEVTNIPFGAKIITKKDDSADYSMLNELGGILGLTTKEIVDIHRNMAEQAFKQKAEVILADGQLTKAKIKQLNEVQEQVGLPAEHAQKLIKSITTTRMAAAIETSIARGKFDIKQVRELKEANVDLESIVSERLRENLFKRTVDGMFSSGTGEFDEDEVYEKIPADLNIDAGKAKGVVHELAKARLSNSLIQAVALLRQRNRQGVVSALNDLVACDKAVPSEPLSWEVPEELLDLFAIYTNSNPAPEKLSRIQYLLGISDPEAATLRESGNIALSVLTEEEEFAF